MKKLMHLVILDCEKASLLVLKKEEGKLSALERFQLWLHYKVCEPCPEFENQNEVINVNIKHHFNNGHIHTMPKDLKAKLKDIVK